MEFMRLQPEDFHIQTDGQQAAEITIRARLSGLTDSEKRTFAEYLTYEGAQVALYVHFEVAQNLLGVAGRPLTVLLRLRMPSARQQLERVEALHAALLILLTPGLAYVDPRGKLAGFNPRLGACFSQRHRRIGAEAELYLVSAAPIAESPCLAGGPYAKVPVDHAGIDVDAGIATARHARAAFVTPSHQYPLGVPMSMGRRSALLAWARANDAWIVEDDYDSELRYSGHPFPSLQGLAPDRVVYLGTFSKILFPSLRLGYAIVPDDLVPAFIGGRNLIDRHSPSAEQHVLAAFIAEGHLERHIRRVRGVYADRREQLIGMLARWIPKDLGWLQPSDQGMHLMLWLAKDIDDVLVASRALESGVAVRAVSPMYSSGNGRRGLILGLGGFSNEQMEAAVRKLAAVLLSMRKGKPLASPRASKRNH